MLQNIGTMEYKLELPVEIIQTICIPMDSIRSSDMLKKDNESFQKLIVENKHDRQSHQAK